jgi:hypothetical protein
VRTYFNLALLLSIFSAGIAIPAPAQAQWAQSASGQWASFNYGAWTVYQNEWGSTAPCTLYANSASNWASAGNWTGPGTKGYPHVQGNPNVAIGSTWTTASFNFSGPSGGVYTLVFDCWTAGYADELMIEESKVGTDGHWGTQIASNQTIGGRLFASIWQAHNGYNNVIIFTPASYRTSGTTDIMACFVWARDRGLLANNTLYELSFGPEITSTNGWQQFTMNSFSANWGTPGGGGGTYYKYRNVATSLYMDGMGRTNNGANCGQYANGGSFNQQWTRSTTGSFVKLQNRGTGLFLDGMGRTTNGSICGQYAGGSSNNQQWTETTVSGNYKFQNRGTGLFVDGMGRTNNGADMGQWSGGNSNNQRFARSTP